MQDNDDSLQSELTALVGLRGNPRIARDPVNQSAIRNWCDAIGVDNPRYIEGAAPAAMMPTWTRPGNTVLTDDSERPLKTALAVLGRHGFAAIIGTAHEEEQKRLLRVGERLSETLTLTDVSERKKTGLGEGYFLTTRREYSTELGEVVGSWTMRLLVFRPRAGSDVQPAAAVESAFPRQCPPMSVSERRAMTRRFADIAVGAELAPWSIAVTPLLIISGAMATRDFTDIHHDAAAARRVGVRDVFMNAMTSSGLCSRYVEDWAGPDVLQRGVRLRLGMPCVAGDCLTLSATVAGKTEMANGGAIVLDVRGRVDGGDHLTGQAFVELPL